MFISNLTVENWVGNRNEGELIEAPTWEQIETAIRELDGYQKTLVTLGANDDTYMAIGGGKARKYIAYITFDNLSFYNLVDSSKSDDLEALVVGGQAGDYPTKMCVNWKTALKAAKTFTESGKLEQSVDWEKDGTAVQLSTELASNVF